MEKTYRIEGMTCGHCKGRRWRKGVGTIAGVASVEVDLDGGRATVTGEGFTDGRHGRGGRGPARGGGHA